MPDAEDPQLAALLETTRIDVVGLLMRNPEGLSAGEIARRLGSAQNAMASHTRKLLAVGLVVVKRDGRHQIYRVVPDAVRGAMRRMAEAIGAA